MTKLNGLTLVQAIEGLKNKAFTSVELVEACYSQIAQYDSKIRAFITLTKESALKSAKKADKLLSREGKTVFNKYPLLGIPYACKDNFNTKGVTTTAGSAILKNYVPPFESTVTQKLKDAGAIVLGKTNMDAFAHGSSTERSDFFKTTNPWDYSRVPGGSSGGSAAAVAADMAIFGIGSETAGSVRGPAAWCGITGFKPSYGRVSRYGLIAMASSTDQPGPLTKTIEDAALILGIIAGKDQFDATTSPAPAPDYLDSLNGKDNLKGVRVGKPRSYFGSNLEAGVAGIINTAIDVYKTLGAEIVDIDLLDPRYSIAVYTILQRSEVSSNLARLDGIRYGDLRETFGMEAKNRMMLGAYALSAGYYDQYYAKAQKVRTLLVEDFARAFTNVDAIIGPSMPCTALKLGESEGASMFGELMDVLTEPSAIAGLTAVSLPSGVSKLTNMPVGMQLIAPMQAENRLFELAHIFQKNTDYHKVKPVLQ